MRSRAAPASSAGSARAADRGLGGQEVPDLGVVVHAGVQRGAERAGGERVDGNPGACQLHGRRPLTWGWRSTLRNMDRHEHREKRSGSAAQATEWDARYSERDGARWSGRPNGRLLAEVASLTPGRALDVGCGEGADAIWLARQWLDGHRNRRFPMWQ